MQQQKQQQVGLICFSFPTTIVLKTTVASLMRIKKGFVTKYTAYRVINIGTTFLYLFVCPGLLFRTYSYEVSGFYQTHINWCFCCMIFVWYSLCLYLRLNYLITQQSCHGERLNPCLAGTITIRPAQQWQIHFLWGPSCARLSPLGLGFESHSRIWPHG